MFTVKEMSKFQIFLLTYRINEAFNNSIATEYKPSEKCGINYYNYF